MIGAGAFLAECEALSPQTLNAAVGSVELARLDLDSVRLDEPSFAAAPSISVEQAIFEKTTKAAAIAVNFDWSELGS